jgi:hypothetical protein
MNGYEGYNGKCINGTIISSSDNNFDYPSFS